MAETDAPMAESDPDFVTSVQPVLDMYWPLPTTSELKAPSRPDMTTYAAGYNAIYHICTNFDHDDSAKRVMPPLEETVKKWVAAARAYVEAGPDDTRLERYLAAWETFKKCNDYTKRMYIYPDRHLFPQWDDGSARLPTDYARQPYERFIPSSATGLRRWRTDIYEAVFNNDAGVEIIKAAIPDDNTARRKEVREILLACGALYGEGPIDILK